MPLKTILVFCLFSLSTFCFAQTETIRLTLEEVIALAQSDAPDVLIAQTRLSNNYWIYQSFLADYKPQIDLSGQIPAWNRSIVPTTQEDGTVKYTPINFLSNSVGLSLSQDIALTGGRIFATTNLERNDFFQDISTTAYLSTPISIGFQQPLFAFNELKWNKKIEPLRYEEASREYAENMEQIAYDAAQLFFQVFLAQLNVKAQEKNKANADSLYRISQGRFEVGRIAETELLQIELSSSNATANLAQSTLNLQTTTEQLRNFLGITKAVNFDLIAPDEIPDLVIDGTTALNQARQNRAQSIRLKRQLLEAKGAVTRAEKENGINANLFGLIGFTGTDNTLWGAYQQPDYQDRVTLGIEVPIADWGKRQARLEIAQSNQKLVQMNTEQERVNFEREILLKVQQFDLVRNQVTLAERAYEISQKREDITRKRYFIGKIGITELNLALRELDEGRVSYINALRRFWLAYYELRNLCLYDFEKGKPLVKTLEGY